MKKIRIGNKVYQELKTSARGRYAPKKGFILVKLVLVCSANPSENNFDPFYMKWPINSRTDHHIY